MDNVNTNAGWGSAVPVAPERDSPAWIMQRDAKLAEWEASKTALDNAKADEMRLRKEFVDFTFDPNQREGTESVELHNGFQAKAVKKCTYALVSRTEGVDVVDAVEMMLDRLEGIGADGKFIAARIVKWSCDLSLSEYRKLNAEQQAIVDSVVETRDAAPTLEIVAPKGKK